MQDILRAPELQGIAALIAIAQIVFTIGKALWPPERSDSTSGETLPRTSYAPSSPSRFGVALGAVLFLVLCWLMYCVFWAGLAFALRFPPGMVISVTYFVLGAFVALGVLITKMPLIGGFLGGGLPLGTLALYFVSINTSMAAMAPGLAWFTVFGIFGGLLGAVIGVSIVQLMRVLKLPLPM
jgi:hypothetical protein